MHILLGLLLACALLYFWLLGHWFARVLVFLLLTAALGFVGAAFVAVHSGPDANAGAVGGAAMGILLAWPLAGLPVYFWRWHISNLAKQQAAIDAEFHRTHAFDAMSGRLVKVRN